MKKIPITFCFDDNLVMQAGVCITSLLENANEDTFYDIFILHDDNCKFPFTKELDILTGKYRKCNITYRSVGNPFPNAFEIRGITVAAYYRLLIPAVIPEYDKIMYHDVDVIFRSDLSDIFISTNLDGYYVGGVVSTGALDAKTVKERTKMGLDPTTYINSGDLVFNSRALREDNIVSQFVEQVNNVQYTYQDQDVVNMVCKDKILRMPPSFCVTIGTLRIAAYDIEQSLYTQEELNTALNNGIIHYNGPKPWNQYCPNFDIWWEYYRRSPFYDADFYFDFFYKKMDEHERLPLWKRIKILLRYFTYGQRK